MPPLGGRAGGRDDVRDLRDPVQDPERPRAISRPEPEAEDQLEAARKKLGVDQPFFVQYGRFLWRVAHPDLGYSYTSIGVREPVPSAIIVLNLLVDLLYPLVDPRIRGGA